MFELLPYKWEWGGISQLYYNMSASTASVHHFAWRWVGRYRPTGPPRLYVHMGPITYIGHLHLYRIYHIYEFMILPQA